MASKLYQEASKLLNQGQYEKSIPLYDQAIQLNPNYTEAYSAKGTAFSCLARYPEALEMFEKAIELDSNNADAQGGKGTVFNFMDRYEEAISFFDKSIELNSNNFMVHNNRAYALTNLGRYQEALVSCDKCIELNPNEPNVYFNKGTALLYLDRYEEALPSFDKAIELSPNYALFHYVRGRNYIQLRKENQALPDLKIAQSLIESGNPGNNTSKEKIEYMRVSLKSIIRLQEKANQADNGLKLLQKNNHSIEKFSDKLKDYREEKIKLCTEIMTQIELADKASANKFDGEIGELEEKFDKELGEIRQELRNFNIKEVNLLKKEKPEKQGNMEKKGKSSCCNLF